MLTKCLCTPLAGYNQVQSFNDRSMTSKFNYDYSYTSPPKSEQPTQVAKEDHDVTDALDKFLCMHPAKCYVAKHVDYFCTVRHISAVVSFYS